MMIKIILGAMLPIISYSSKIVLKPLPILYVYDHCPFCVRVRLAFGLKSIKHDVRFLANDDVVTPTSLVGKKVVPIFEFQNTAGQKIVMPESLDIISKVDSDPSFGPVGLFKPMSKRADWADWQSKYAELMRELQRSRYVMSVLPEFYSTDGKDAFVKNHPIAPYSKNDWALLSKEEQWKIYSNAYTSSLDKIADGTVDKALIELNDIVHCPECVSEGGLSLDDIDFWSRVRSLTLVKGIKWPEKLLAYMTNIAAKGDVPLYFPMAC
eukprot:gene26861-35229_t